MKKCAHCNKNITFFENLFRLDEDYCDECLMEMNVEIREKTSLAITDSNSRQALTSLAQGNENNYLTNQSQSIEK